MITRISAPLEKASSASVRGEKAVTTLVLGYPAVQYQRTAQREPADVLFD